MRIALTTDTHFGASNNTQKIHERFLKKLVGENFDVLVHTGDIVSHKQKQLYRSLQMFREALGEIPMLIVLGNHDCLDKDTELLTKRGWLHYLEITKTDMILSINNDGFSEWTPIDQIIIKKSDKVFSYSNTSIDMCITENHRILCSKRNSRGKYFEKLDYTTLDDMTYSRYRFPVSAKNNNVDYPITDDEIILLGWVLTDGGIRKSSCQIYQSKIKGRSDIKQLLRRLDYKFSSSIRQRKTDKICGKKLKRLPLVSETFFILSESLGFIESILGNDKSIKDPEIFNKFSTRQLQLFLRSLMSGDGSWATGYMSGALDGKFSFLGWVQTLAAQCGASASLVEYREGDFRLNITFDREFVQVDNFKKEIKEVVYNDFVWCLNVPYTNFMVRRNGRSYFTGNCWDQDSWNNGRYNKRTSYEEMKSTQREWFEELKIHYLQDNPFYFKDEAIFYGYDGWYLNLPPPSNDKNWMPPTAKQCPIDQYLSYRANKSLDAILVSAEEAKKLNPNIKTLCATHHSLTSYRGGFDTMGGNPRHLDFLSENMDYVLNGHSHQEVDQVHEYLSGNTIHSCRIINAGSDYDKPKYKIFDI